VYSAYLAFSAVFAILAGWALDRFGSKVVFTVMGLFTALGLLLTSRVGSPWHLFVTYSLLLAIGTGAIYPVSISTVNRWFIRRRGLALGIVNSGATVGLMAMGPFAAYIVSTYGWQTAALIIGLMALFIVAPCSLLLRRSPSEIAAIPKDEALELTGHGSHEGKQYNGPEGLSLSQAVRTRNFWLLSLMLFMFACCAYLVMAHLVRHVIDLGISPIQAASLLSFIGGGGLVGKLLMGRAADYIGTKRAYIVCPLLMAGAMLLLVKSSDFWMFYLFATALGFAFGALGVTNAALFGDVFGLRHLGVIMGAAEVCWQAGAAIGPLLGGYIFDISGSYVPAFITGMLVSLVVALVPLLSIPKPSSSK